VCLGGSLVDSWVNLRSDSELLCLGSSVFEPFLVRMLFRQRTTKLMFMIQNRVRVWEAFFILSRQRTASLMVRLKRIERSDVCADIQLQLNCEKRFGFDFLIVDHANLDLKLSSFSSVICVRRKLPTLHPSRGGGEGGNNSLPGLFTGVWRKDSHPLPPGHSLRKEGARSFFFSLTNVPRSN